MGNWIFAWIFTLIVYWILPDAVLTKTEMISMIFFFVSVGYYIWDGIGKAIRRNKNNKKWR